VEYVRVFAVNSWELIKWFWNNFGDICKTGVDFLLTAMINLGTNIRNLWKAILDFIAGKGWKFDATPMLEGFKSSVKEMPEFVKAQDLGDFGLNEILDKAKELDTKWEDVFSKNVKPNIEDTKKELKDMVGDIKPIQNIKEDHKKDKTKAGEFKGAAEVWKSMQTSILKGQEDRQLNAQIQGNRLLEKMNNNLEKIADKEGVNIAD
jgi:hypothetical protein